MAVTFADLQTRLFNRGFTYLNDAGNGLIQAKAWINQSYHTLCESDLSQGGTWPFLQVTTTSVAPYTFTDLRHVLSVVDATTEVPLTPIDRRTLLEEVAVTLTTTGTPAYWWLEGEVLKVYPVSTTDTLSIRYVKYPADMSGGTDVPLCPDRYAELIVDGACIRAYLNKDNFEAAAALQVTLDRGITQMADSLLFRHDRTPVTVAQRAFHEDG